MPWFDILLFYGFIQISFGDTVYWLNCVFIMSGCDLVGNSFCTEVHIMHLLLWLSLQSEEEEDCHLLFKSQTLSIIL